CQTNAVGFMSLSSLRSNIELLFKLGQRFIKDINHLLNLTTCNRQRRCDEHDVAGIHVDGDEPILAGDLAQHQTECRRGGAFPFVQHDLKSRNQAKPTRLAKTWMMAE